jgi:hypothetical protein
LLRLGDPWVQIELACQGQILQAFYSIDLAEAAEL